MKLRELLADINVVKTNANLEMANKYMDSILGTEPKEKQSA